eukprot:2561742-Prymnesium_polylepis.1
MRGSGVSVGSIERVLRPRLSSPWGLRNVPGLSIIAACGLNMEPMDGCRCASPGGEGGGVGAPGLPSASCAAVLQ